MKYYGLIVTILAALMISAGNGKPVPWQYKVKREVYRYEHSDSSTQWYTYDAQGRQIMDTFHGDFPAPTVRTSYLGDTVRRWFSRDEKSYDYILDSLGHAVKSNFGEHLYFDKNGFCLLRSSRYRSTQYTVIDSDVIIWNEVVDIHLATFGYTYYPELDLRDYGKSYMGRRSAHLIRYMITKNDDNTLDTMDYHYTLDALGRVQMETRVRQGKTDTSFLQVEYMK